MSLHNQTSFLNHYQDNKINVKIILSTGIILRGKITSHDVFTLILNDEGGRFKQQTDFINHYKMTKEPVLIVSNNQDNFCGVITGVDMYSIILDDKSMFYKSNIGSIKPTKGDDLLVFKNSITSITI